LSVEQQLSALSIMNIYCKQLYVVKEQCNAFYEDTLLNQITLNGFVFFIFSKSCLCWWKILKVFLYYVNGVVILS